MSNSYPYDAWVLKESMSLMKVTITTSVDHAHVKSGDGRVFPANMTYPSAFRAIEAGHGILDGNQAAIDRKQKKLDARRVNLDKAHERISGVHA